MPSEAGEALRPPASGYVGVGSKSGLSRDHLQVQDGPPRPDTEPGSASCTSPGGETPALCVPSAHRLN